MGTDTPTTAVAGLHPRLARPRLTPGVVRALALFVAAGALLYLGGLLWAGRSETLASMARVGWPAVLLLAVLSASSLLWRFARWHWLLGQQGSRPPVTWNLLAWLAGLALTTSPGKLGEAFRSVLLLTHGVPVPRSLAAFFAERGADLIGVCALGAAAAVLAGREAWLLGGLTLALLAASGLFAAALRHPGAAGPWGWLDARLRWLPVRGGQATLEAWARVWRGRRVPVYALVGAIAYGTQALVFVAICHRVGMPVGTPEGVLMFVNATLFGAASLVPGGLGAMEAALVVQLLAAGADQQAAVAIAITTRLLTLWLAIGLGVGALWLLVGQRGPHLNALPRES